MAEYKDATTINFSSVTNGQYVVLEVSGRRGTPTREGRGLQWNRKSRTAMRGSCKEPPACSCFIWGLGGGGIPGRTLPLALQHRYRIAHKQAWTEGPSVSCHQCQALLGKH